MFLYSYFTNLHKDIIDIIIDYSRPTKYEEINNYLLLLNNNDEYNNDEYNNDEYNRWIRFSQYIKFKNYKYNNCENKWVGGYLLDLMSSGCTLPFVKKSKECFDQYFREDLQYILKNYDNCLDYPYGTLRCREGISPLSMSCININVPVSIIDILLKNGGNVNESYFLNGCKIKLLNDLKYHLYDDNLNSERVKQIEQIFIFHIS